MAQYDALNAQCFVKRDYAPLFTSTDTPELLYACHIRSDISDKHPRIMHSHEDLAEMVLVYNGSGQYLIGNKKYHVEKGDLLIYNAGILHDETPVPDSDLAFYTIAVGSIQLPGLAENALVTKKHGYRFRTGRHFDDFLSMFRIIFRNLSEEEPDAERFCSSMMLALLGKVLSLVEEQKGGAAKTHESDSIDEPGALTERVMSYIDANYMNPITIQDITASLHASPYYISHIFKEETGYSPIQYLLRRRIGEAQTLLITTTIPIVDIAGMVGYDTQSYFTTQFTKYVGMPPKQYRQNYITDKFSLLSSGGSDTRE